MGLSIRLITNNTWLFLEFSLLNCLPYCEVCLSLSPIFDAITHAGGTAFLSLAIPFIRPVVRGPSPWSFSIIVFPNSFTRKTYVVIRSIFSFITNTGETTLWTNKQRCVHRFVMTVEFILKCRCQSSARELVSSWNARRRRAAPFATQNRELLGANNVGRE